MIRIVGLIVVVAMQAGVWAKATQPAEAPRTGTFETKFTERSPLSTPEQLSKRLGLPKAASDYDLSKYDFIVHVPTTYDPAKPVGVMYLLNYKDSNEPPMPCLPFFDERGVIFVVPKSKGPSVPTRCGQALDVLHNLKKQYKIDESRLYLFAMFRGMHEDDANDLIALTCGDVFSGLFLMEGRFWKKLPAKNGNFWSPGTTPPPAAGLAASRRRAVILAHRTLDERTAGVRRGYESEGFRHLAQMECGAEDMHYPNCSPDYLRKVLDQFDELIAKANTKVAEASPAESAPAGAATKPAAAATKPAPAQPPVLSEPARMLKLAESYISAGSYTQARARLKTIIEKYPTAPEAAKAKALLKEIESK